MIIFSDWIPQAAAGLMFTLIGGLKLWGLEAGRRGRCR